MTAQPTEATAELRAARDFLFEHRDDYDGAVAGFQWPRPGRLNWALEWFDVIAQEHPDRDALVIVEEDGTRGAWTYGSLSARSDQVAGWLRENGVRRGDRVIVMLGNQVELWEVILACIKLGAVIIPASTLLNTPDLQDRCVAAAPGSWWLGRSTRRRSVGCRAPSSGSPSARPFSAGSSTRTPRTITRSCSWTAPPSPATRCCCTSPRGPPHCRNWSSTRMCRTRSGTCRRCSGSACSRRTYT